MENSNCWHCGHPSAKSLFCQFCNTLQPPTPDYYRFLGLECRLRLDPKELQERFYSLSRRLHPDLFTRHDATERQHSLEATAILNDAYRVLRDPVLRAQYILRDQGIELSERRSHDVPPELLEEVFELNLALEEMRGGDAAARPQLEQARVKFAAMREAVDAELDQLFAKYDAGRDRAVLFEIRSVLDRRKYIENLLRQVGEELVARD